MKLAVISDIHGNYKAFEAFLAYIEDKEVDAILCLGDYVTDSPYPQRTMELLFQMMEKYTCYMVRGNREQYLIDNYYHPQGWKLYSSANGCSLTRTWSCNNHHRSIYMHYSTRLSLAKFHISQLHNISYTSYLIHMDMGRYDLPLVA